MQTFLPEKPPYGVILKRLLKGKVVPVLGAGASLVGRTKEAWAGPKSGCAPTGRELSTYLAEYCEYPSKEPHKLGELARVSSFYQAQCGRTELCEQLHEVFAALSEPNCLHKFLVDIVKPNSPLLFVVTNYDTLLEQEFNRQGKPYDLVVYPTEDKSLDNAVMWWKAGTSSPKAVLPNQLRIDLTNTTVIFKMHGTVMPDTSRWDNFVITEENYLDFLSRMIQESAVPAIFGEYFRLRSFLFLGYSLQDWNFRVILRDLRRPVGTIDRPVSRRVAHETEQPSANAQRTVDLPSWAIQLHVEDDDKTLWQARRVNLYSADLKQFVEEMERRM